MPGVPGRCVNYQMHLWGPVIGGIRECTICGELEWDGSPAPPAPVQYADEFGDYIDGEDLSE